MEVEVIWLPSLLLIYDSLAQSHWRHHADDKEAEMFNRRDLMQLLLYCGIYLMLTSEMKWVLLEVESAEWTFGKVKKKSSNQMWTESWLTVESDKRDNVQALIGDKWRDIPRWFLIDEAWFFISNYQYQHISATSMNCIHKVHLNFVV